MINMKKNSNVNLQSAKNCKNDEFYTTYECIDKELINYSGQFFRKTVLCNCDDPFESNFCKFFIVNFNKFGLKRLICTSYKSSPIACKELPFDGNNGNQGYSFILDNVNETDIRVEEALSIINSGSLRQLNGSGDFASQECIDYLKEADIVVTNPPFSLFRPFISLLVAYKKKFLVIGNMNAITYKEIFPLILNNEAWLGYNNGDMAFRVPENTEPRKTRFWIDDTGQKWRSLGNAMWLTNLDVAYRHKTMALTTSYNPLIHRKFDNYEAINVPKVSLIPYNYNGVMAVPLTILNKYNPDQFEIVGEANHGSDNPYDLFKPVIDGKSIFKRILIRVKR